MILLQYLDEKDAFQHFYISKLSKCLIYGTSGSHDAEELMISNLKVVVGFEYTDRLHHMLQGIYGIQGLIIAYLHILQ